MHISHTTDNMKAKAIRKPTYRNKTGDAYIEEAQKRAKTEKETEETSTSRFFPVACSFSYVYIIRHGHAIRMHRYLNKTGECLVM